MFPIKLISLSFRRNCRRHIWSIVFCGANDVCLANIFESPLVTAVDFGSFNATVTKGRSRLRTFAVSILTPDLILKSMASCNFENVSPLNSTLAVVENIFLKVLKRQ